MNFFGRNLQGPAMVIVIFAAIFLVSAGLCGLQLALVTHSSRSDNLASALMIPGILELIAMGVSIIGIVIVLMAWAIGSLTRQTSDKALLDQSPAPDSADNNQQTEPQPPDGPNGNP
jgi:hypothetical protein